MRRNTDAEDRAEVEVARGKSRFDSRNSKNIESFLKTGCWATRLTKRSRATLRRDINSFSVDLC